VKIWRLISAVRGVWVSTCGLHFFALVLVALKHQAKGRLEAKVLDNVGWKRESPPLLTSIYLKFQLKM